MNTNNNIERFEDIIVYAVAGCVKSFRKAKRHLKRTLRNLKDRAEDFIVEKVVDLIEWWNRLRKDPFEIVMTVLFVMVMAFVFWGVASWWDVITKNDPILGSEPKATWNLFVLMCEFFESIGA